MFRFFFFVIFIASSSDQNCYSARVMFIFYYYYLRFSFILQRYQKVYYRGLYSAIKYTVANHAAIYKEREKKKLLLFCSAGEISFRFFFFFPLIVVVTTSKHIRVAIYRRYNKIGIQIFAICRH